MDGSKLSKKIYFFSLNQLVATRFRRNNNEITASFFIITWILRKKVYSVENHFVILYVNIYIFSFSTKF